MFMFVLGCNVKCIFSYESQTKISKVYCSSNSIAELHIFNLTIIQIVL